MMDKIINVLETLVLIMVGLTALGIMGGLTYALYKEIGIIGGIGGVLISGAIVWVSYYFGKRS